MSFDPERGGEDQRKGKRESRAHESKLLPPPVLQLCLRHVDSLLDPGIREPSSECLVGISSSKISKTDDEGRFRGRESE